MSETEYSYATSILTSKSPEQAAGIISKSVEGMQTLIERQLIGWYGKYTQLLQKHNQELQNLFQEGAGIFNHEEMEQYQGFQAMWNCLLNSVQVEVNANEKFFKTLKVETIAPLKDFFGNDVRYSEFLMNAQEVQGLSEQTRHNKMDAEVEWNMKAPQIFENFENIKKYELQLLFNSVYSFMNGLNTKSSKNLSNGENSVNYLLSSFKLDKEMQNYLKYIMQRNDFKVLRRSRTGSVFMPKNSSPQKHTKTASEDFGGTSASQPSKADKRTSKLKSKFGSIFGMKNKTRKSGAVNEQESLQSSVGARNALTDSLGNALNRSATSFGRNSRARLRSLSSVAEPKGTPGLTQSTLQEKLSREMVPGYQASSLGTQPTSSSQHYPQNRQPLHQKPVGVSSQTYPNQFAQRDERPPTVPKQQDSNRELPKPASFSSAPLSPRHAPTRNTEVNTSPNIVKYGGDSSENEESNSKALFDNRQKTHNKEAALPPKDASDRVFDNSSKNPPQIRGAPVLQEYNTPPDLDQSNVFQPAANDASNEKQAAAAPSAQHASMPPSPPPTRKVANDTRTSHKHVWPDRKSLNSQAFNNLPPARASVLQQPGAAPLSRQDTGASLLRSDETFRHFASSGYVESSGLNCSIAEVINVRFENDTLVKSQKVGEVAFNYNNKDTTEDKRPFDVQIPFSFDKVITNTMFVERLKESIFRINPAPIVSRTLGGLKFLTNESTPPIIIQQIWKHEENQSSLMISLKLNENYADELMLQNLIVSVALKDCKTLVASSKPQGSFNESKNRITWRYNAPVNLSSSNPQEKLIARFSTVGKGAESDSGVQIKFSIENPPEGAPIVAGDGRPITCVKNLISGTYSGHT